MARIEFRPVCSACKQVIFKTVDVEEPIADNYARCDGRPIFMPMDPTIKPSRCPSCGALFESIIMTDRIPFTDYPEEDKNA